MALMYSRDDLLMVLRSVESLLLRMSAARWVMGTLQLRKARSILVSCSTLSAQASRRQAPCHVREMIDSLRDVHLPEVFENQPIVTCLSAP